MPYNGVYPSPKIYCIKILKAELHGDGLSYR